MPSLSDLLIRHQTIALFLIVLAEQSGVPIPATPALLAVGASKSHLPVQFLGAIVVSTVAAVVGDSIWYWLGRRYGRSMLRAICRVSMEPASCAKRATEAFGRRGPRLLLVAKFIPGVSTTAPTLAALFGVRPTTFLLWDAAGSAIWAGAFLLLGAIIREQISGVLALLRQLGTAGLVIVVVALSTYVAIKAMHRRRFLRRLRVNRITPIELSTLMASGAPVIVADLRHALDIGADGTAIPGAIRLAPEVLATRGHEFPPGHDVVLYCSCPDEATSASIALQLRAQGIDRIRPLHGGFDGWRNAGLPVVAIKEPVAAAQQV